MYILLIGTAFIKRYFLIVVILDLNRNRITLRWCLRNIISYPMNTSSYQKKEKRKTFYRSQSNNKTILILITSFKLCDHLCNIRLAYKIFIRFYEWVLYKKVIISWKLSKLIIIFFLFLPYLYIQHFYNYTNINVGHYQ